MQRSAQSESCDWWARAQLECKAKPLETGPMSVLFFDDVRALSPHLGGLLTTVSISSVEGMAHQRTRNVPRVSALCRVS